MIISVSMLLRGLLKDLSDNALQELLRLQNPNFFELGTELLEVVGGKLVQDSANLPLGYLPWALLLGLVTHGCDQLVMHTC